MSGPDGTTGPDATADGGRAVFTGLSVIAPNGATTKQFWDATLNGVSGIREISAFDAALLPGPAGRMRSATSWCRSWWRAALVVQTDRWTQFGLVATERALEDAGIDPGELDPYDLSVVTAASSGGNEFGQREIQKLWADGPRFVGPYQSIAWFYAATTGQISIRHGMKGACGVLIGEQAGGLDALAQSRRSLRSDARAAICGGTDAPLSPYALACHATAGLLTTRGAPDSAYLPFSAEADGYVAA